MSEAPPPPRRRRLRRLALELAVVVALVAAIGFWRGRGHPRGEVPELTLRSVAGMDVALRELRGEPTLIAFFAPWCGVCKVTAQNVRWVHGAGRRVVSIGSAYGDDAASVAAYARDHELPSPVLLDDQGAAERFGVTAYPTFFFVDARGRITGSTVGYTTTLGLLARLWL